MRTKLIFAMMMVLGGCLGGCTTLTTRNNAEWSFFYGTQIGFKTGASKTSDEAASVSADTQALVDWLFKSQQGPVPAAPASKPGG